MIAARGVERRFRTTAVRSTAAAKARNRMRLKALLFIILFSAAMYLAFGAFTAVRKAAAQNNFFTVKSITINGAQKLDESRIRGLLKVGLSGNIFTRKMDAVTTILEKIPVVESASIRLILPDSAEVTIVERKPTAAIALGGKTYLMDARRFVIEEAPADWKGGPVITGSAQAVNPGERVLDSRLDEAFEALSLFSLDNFWHEKGASADIGDKERITLVSSSGVYIRLGPDKTAWREKFYEYMSVRRISVDMGARFAGYDLSFDGQVVGVNRDGDSSNNKTKRSQGVS